MDFLLGDSRNGEERKYHHRQVDFFLLLYLNGFSTNLAAKMVKDEYVSAHPCHNFTNIVKCMRKYHCNTSAGL